MSGSILKNLPPEVDLESKRVLKRVNDANRELAALNGFSRTIPNQEILINALSLQEAKDSSEIENIITTHDELYRFGLFEGHPAETQAKEVQNYAQALHEGFRLVRSGGLLTINNICAIQRLVEMNDAGIRTQAGTVLMNPSTGGIVYTPPQNRSEILDLMGNLEKVINDDAFWPDIDPLIKMAVIHCQFESIHPFYDGNGRTGRILNVLYLVLKGLLDSPILYLSRYIVNHKRDYYRHLRNINQSGDWESFILYMLDAVVETSRMTVRTVKEIHQATQDTKKAIREQFSFYSRDLVDALFLYPYTRIPHLQRQLGISRNTATAYLNKLSEANILEKVQYGRNVYFTNKALFEILTSIPCTPDTATEEIVTENVGGNAKVDE